MTSVLMTPDGKTVEAEAAHGPSPGTTGSISREAHLDQSDCVDLRLDAWAGAPRQTRRHPEVIEFAHTLEEVVIAAVEGGKMTKDLALLIGPDQPWQTSEQFLAILAEHLDEALAEAV